MAYIDRRNFIRTAVLGGVAATVISPSKVLAANSTKAKSAVNTSSVSLSAGDNRVDMTFRALKPYSERIKQDIGNKRVILKPNLVSIDNQLAATHVDTLEGILEFLKSIKKLDNVIIAESAASGATFDGFTNFKYFSLAQKYPVKFMDLDEEGHELLYVFDEKDFRPHPVRYSKVMLNPDTYIVSVTKFKTHDRAVVTLSLKNIILGAPIKDKGYMFGRSSKPGAISDKSVVHGNGFRGINYNLFDMSRRIHPDLAVIDGLQGMEGNGPINGTAIDHGICLASPNWFAADRVGVELMGVDFAKVGYLNYIANAGYGEADLSKIEVIGESVASKRKEYKMNRNIESQLVWMKPAV